jgi:hypothetical protein
MMARLLRSSFFRANIAITIVIILAIGPIESARPCEKPINRQKGKRQSLVMEIHPQSSKKEPFVCVCVCFDLSHKLSQELMTTLSLPEHKGRESLADDQDRLN